LRTPIMLLSVRPALSRSPAPEQVDDGEKHDGADERHQQRANAEGVLVDRRHTYQRRYEKPCDCGADDADDDVEKNALLCIGAHDEAGYPAEYSADDEPNDKIDDHRNLLRRCRSVALNTFGSASEMPAKGHPVFRFQARRLR